MENHKGQDCPYFTINPLTCQEGYCLRCQIHLDRKPPAEEAILARQAMDDDYNEQIEDLL